MVRQLESVFFTSRYGDNEEEVSRNRLPKIHRAFLFFTTLATRVPIYTPLIVCRQAEFSLQ